MAAPYVVNLIINTDTTFTQTFSLSGDNGTSLDLSNYQINSQLRKHPQSSSYVDFITTAVSPTSSGVIKISLPSDSTTNLKTGRYMYDIVITNTVTGEKQRVIEGSAIVSKSITRSS